MTGVCWSQLVCTMSSELNKIYRKTSACVFPAGCNTTDQPEEVSVWAGFIAAGAAEHSFSNGGNIKSVLLYGKYIICL